MTARLPPLNTLRLFEAAARHLSFTEAATELGITRSAVGHGVSSLEAWLGVPLFVRSGRGLSLTDDGRSYHPVVTECLASISSAVEGVPGRRINSEVRISVVPTLAARVLGPRLARFYSGHPDISLILDTAHRMLEFPRDGVDLAIRLGTGAWPNLVSEKLIDEVVRPCAAPDTAAEALRSGIASVGAIRVSSVLADWPEYIERSGLDGLRAMRVSLTVDTIDGATQAAMGGMGVSLGRGMLVRDELAKGSLVHLPFPEVATGLGYWLVATPESLVRREVRALWDWVRQEFRELSSAR